MSISPVTSGASATTAAATRKTSLSQEDFMNLFTTQMKFQNPLEPLDNYQMATQLAQFNTVDALAKMNETLNQWISSQSAQAGLQASSLIGKKIEAKGDHLTVSGGGMSEGEYQLSRAGNALIQIFDSAGVLVRQIDAGYKDASKQKIGWNGKSQEGAALPDGVYTFRVVAADVKGQEVPVTTYRLGTVDGVSLENGTAVFQMGADKVSFSDILSIVN